MYCYTVVASVQIVTFRYGFWFSRTTYIVYTLLLCTELQAKFSAEQEAKVKAIERYNSSQHQCSMLEMDIENSRDEARKVSKELEIATEKVQLCTCACTVH